MANQKNISSFSPPVFTKISPNALLALVTRLSPVPSLPALFTLVITRTLVMLENNF